ncbi:Uma2 family endonuclease [Nostoc sp. CHAB 5834]|nr:Uma2 family endonuclease [Nostoc sp. CHAB 5834]
MFQHLVEAISFEEFVEWKPENSRYELHKGVIVEMQPTGEHELVRAFLIRELNFEIRRFNNDQIQSPTLIELNLTAEQVFKAVSGEQ